MKHRAQLQSSRRAASGFTLIELMIAVVVVAILAGVALPSYLSSVRKGRRSDAVSSLTSLQQAQERWRANNSSYTTVLSNLVPSVAASSATMTSPNGYYTIDIDSADGANYVLTAQANAGMSQAKDTLCTTMRLQLYNGAVAYWGCNGCAAPTVVTAVTDPNGCWAK